MRQLNSIRAVGSKIDVPVPIELLTDYIDQNRSPDEYTAKKKKEEHTMQESLQCKKHAFACLEKNIRAQAGALLDDSASAGPMSAPNPG